MNRLDMQGRGAIVTGGAAGIGLAIARRLAASGARVSLWDRDADALERALMELGKGHHGQVLDVTNEDAVAAARDASIAALGRVDALVCSAGITGPNTTVENYPLAAWQQVIDINLTGVFLCNRALVAHMRSHDGGKGYGRIVNIASIAGKEGNPNASAYSASKAAVIALTKSLGKELAATGIRVNCITPAAVKTGMFSQMTQAHIDYMLSKIPLGRFGEVDEIAALVGWLCTEECSFSTGAVFDLSGGQCIERLADDFAHRDEFPPVGKGGTVGDLHVSPIRYTDAVRPPPLFRSGVSSVRRSGHMKRSTEDPPRYAAQALLDCARALLMRAGVAESLANDVAEVLLEGDLLGHDTHGLALLAPYLAEIERGAMRRHGGYAIVSERPAVATWDGQRLPGPWLTRRAIDAAIERARTCGTGTIVVRRSHHIGCLAAYPRRATDHGLVLLLACSDPNAASVAPFGGTRAFVTPNPIACGFPTAGDPVLIDICASITTNGMSARLHRQGRRFSHPWLLDANGYATDDPAVLFADPPGTILPLGGLEAGHKGYGLALMIEALTAGLAGFGRADPKEGWGATVFVQVLDPSAFGGAGDFVRQVQWLREACRSNPPRPDVDRVRLPGERGLARRREQLAHGVALNADILPALAPWAEKLGVALPAAL